MKRLTIIAAILLLLGLFAGAAAAQGDEPPVVRGVLFWSDTCPHCHYVIDEVLPPLQARHGAQLDIALIELDSEANVDLFYAAGDMAGLSPRELGVPMMLVGDAVLFGSAQIPEALPGLITRYLAEGGVDWPAVPGLAQAVAAQRGELPMTLVEPEAGISGEAPALAVLVGMVLALAVAGVVLIRARGGAVKAAPSGWVSWAVPVLAAVGIVVAAYLTYVETQQVAAVCGPVGDCNAVQASRYARLFGVLPVGALGLAGYGAILVAWFRGRPGNATARGLLVGLAAFGVLFSIYLTWLELFVIRAVCMWCVSSAVIMTLILLVAAVWLAGTWAVSDGRPANRRRRRPARA